MYLAYYVIPKRVYASVAVKGLRKARNRMLTWSFCYSSAPVNFSARLTMPSVASSPDKVRSEKAIRETYAEKLQELARVVLTSEGPACGEQVNHFV